MENIQAQDVHEIEKEPETDSAEKQNLFPPSLITAQIIRTALELILVVPLLPLLSNPLGLILFLPFGLYFVLQARHGHGQRKKLRSLGF